MTNQEQMFKIELLGLLEKYKVLLLSYGGEWLTESGIGIYPQQRNTSHDVEKIVREMYWDVD